MGILLNENMLRNPAPGSVYESTLKIVKVNEIIKWSIEWWLSIIEDREIKQSRENLKL